MIGKKISHYHIIEELGRGGMGTIYKAKDTKLERFVALKFLPADLSRAGEEKLRFIHEARTASALQHHNICTIHEIDETEDGQLYIVMDCYEGESLKEKIKRGPLGLDEALDITGQIARGLEKAHAKKIVHRDIKPDNIIITGDGVVKIVDFGLAKLSGRTMLTKEGTTLGTVSYMSPEQTEGSEVDQRTDVWALGVILYEMLTGERPFKGDYEQAIIYSILNESPEPLSSFSGSVPEELQQVVNRSLAKNAAERYRDIKEFKTDLLSVTGGNRYFQSASAGKSILSAKIFLILAVLIFIILGFGFNIAGLRDFITGGFGASTASIRLAVLPFTNLTGDPEQEYLSDGFTQEMIIKLGRLHPERLSVIARTSIMQYKKRNPPVDKIGNELNVGYILEGSTRREGNVINISAELIRVKDHTQLWGATYTQEIKSVLGLQNEVAQRIAEALAIKLLPSEKSSLAIKPTVDPDAYEAYLKGSYHWKKMTVQGLDMAEQYFNLALKKDSVCAAAYEGLAWVWIVRQQFGYMAPHEAGPKAREAALKAIALDQRFAGAYEALAVVKTWVDWNWDSARQSWQRSLALNPNSANANAFYAHFLMIRGQTEKAIFYSKKAVQLDPFNALFHAMRAMVFNYARGHEEAVGAANQALELQPDMEIAKIVLSRALLSTGKVKESHERQMAVQLQKHSNDAEWMAAFEKGLAEGGYKSAQLCIAELLASRYESYGWQGDNVRAINIARRYLDAGNKEKTIEWFEKAYEEHDPNLPYDVRNPIFLDSLKSEPRFQKLLNRMNLTL